MLVNTSNYNEGVQKTMTNITKRSLVAAGVLAALMAGNVALAADVPAGVTLAEKQTLVRNNGSEVQSLDPHKIEGVPESNISRDLFEGLLVSDLDGHPAPGVAESWDNKDAKVWTFHLRKDAKCLMARQSQHKTLCIAGNVLLIRTLLLRMPVICNMGISPVLMKFLKGKNRLPISA